jgi:lipopolysaccharide export LptBFGC system permease protein LptF
LLAAIVGTAYYSSFTLGEFCCRQGWLPATAVMWVPNALLAGSAVALLLRTRR